MFSLVRFIDDGVYSSCKTEKIRQNRKGETTAPYGRFQYPAKILTQQNNLNVLRSLAFNLQFGVPVISIEKCIWTDLENVNIDENNNSFECEEARDEYTSHSEASINESDPFGDDDSVMDPSYEPETDIVLLEPVYSEVKNVHFEHSNVMGSVKESVELNNNTNDFNENNDRENRYKDTGEYLLKEKKTVYTATVEPMPALSLLQQIESYTPPKNQKAVNIISVPHSKLNTKQYFCIFCKKLFSKLVVHLERIHRNEVDVKKFMNLPKGCKERKKIIEIIRKKGCFEFNTNRAFNNGHLITSRRPQQSKIKSAEDYRFCPNCKGVFSKCSIRRHYIHCIPDFSKGDRSVTVMGKRVHGQVHSEACPILRNFIFPTMRDDDVTNIIRYDELIIAFGNRLCLKYRLQHLYKMIRSKLRLLGRFLIHLKEVDNTVTELASAFFPDKFDFVITAVNNLAGLDSMAQEYKAPATASEIGTTLKKCGKLLITQYIKQKNETRKHEVEDFLKILEDEYPASINKTVMENQLEQKRRKKIILPSVNDIVKFNKFLEEKRSESYMKLQNSFNFSVWKDLASYTLLSIQIFNRRRAGEVERITIEDFNSYQSVNDDPDLIKYLPKEYQINAKKYLRFVIRGKKARGVPVLLSKNLVDCIQLILKYRTQAKVNVNNPFVFGLPGTALVHTHLGACELMRKYSKECGASNPENLRGTHLRKQIATQSAVLNLKENEISDLANFLGHAEKVHRDHYKLPIATREVGRISHLLEMGLHANSQESYDDMDNVEEIDLMDPRSETNNTTESRSETNNTTVGTDEGSHVAEQPRDSWSESNTETTVYGKERCTSPYGTVKRKSWNSDEKKMAYDLFQQHIELGDIPSLLECSVAIKNHSQLTNRTSKQLKAWVVNQINNKKSQKTMRRAYWSSEEKTIMLKAFAKHIADGILPSLKKCAEVLEQNSILKNNRNEPSMKAWVNNYIKKKK